MSASRTHVTLVAQLASGRCFNLADLALESLLQPIAGITAVCAAQSGEAAYVLR